MNRDAALYQPFYCEENVWHLARHEALVDRERFVAFVSNERRGVPLWCQRASPDPEMPVLWDYHVILFVEDDGWRVFDLDTTLPFGVDVRRYLVETFRLVREPFAPRFRLIDPDDFAKSLATDRSHMLDGETYRAPPPPWDVIGVGSNVMRFVDLADEGVPGEVVDLDVLVQRLLR